LLVGSVFVLETVPVVFTSVSDFVEVDIEVVRMPSEVYTNV
jgi:hypothetical protein